jgi:hypothetical protein
MILPHRFATAIRAQGTKVIIQSNSPLTAR